MISLNEKTYKTLAQNLTKEVNTVTNDKTINQAKALEIIAISLGYKNYNSILPVLSKNNNSIIELYNSKDALLENGYKDIMDVESIYFSKLNRDVFDDIKKNHQVELFHLFKGAFETKEDKFYIDISSAKLNDYYKEAALLRGLNVEQNKPTLKSIKRDINFLQLTLGVVFRFIWKNENSNLLIYANKKELYNFEINENKEENENYFVKFKTANGPLESKDLDHADLRENIGEIIRENSYLYFTNDQSNVNGIRKIHSKDMVFFTSDKELRISNRLIGDWTNKEINHFFSVDKKGLLRAKYITKNFPEISSFICNSIYGYALDFDED